MLRDPPSLLPDMACRADRSSRLVYRSLVDEESQGARLQQCGTASVITVRQQQASSKNSAGKERRGVCPRDLSLRCSKIGQEQELPPKLDQPFAADGFATMHDN
jgi:hypothetical protein